MSIQKICANCGESFLVPPCRADSAKTCSRKCRGEIDSLNYSGKRIKVKCQNCGIVFLVPKCHAHRRTYCSNKCADPTRGRNAPKQEDHYQWKGGKADHSDGYRYQKIENHPFGGKAGYVFEHRIVMEDWMRAEAPGHRFLMVVGGKLYLKPEIHIHHINEKKSDNRRKNLVACTSAAHREIHNGKPPMKGEVWPDIIGALPYEPRVISRKCLVCGCGFLKKRSDVLRGGGKYCSRACFNKRDKRPFNIKFLSGE